MAVERTHPDAGGGLELVLPPAPVRALAGACVCGGASLRMGRDKALLSPRAGEATLLERAIAALRPVASELVLACGSEPRYADYGLPLALDAQAAAGPLAGLAAALDHARETSCAWLAALACDLPRVDARVVFALYRRAVERDLDACLLRTQGGLEPLFAVYRVEPVAGAVAEALAAGQRRLIAFHDGLASIGELAVDELPRELADCARNANTMADLDDTGTPQLPEGER